MFGISLKSALVFFLSIFSLSSWAAPIPGTSSSQLISGKNGLYHSQIGFKMSAEGTDWKLTPPPADSKYLLTLYRSPDAFKNIQASLSVRVDRMPKKTKLKSYVKKWLRQYPRFGFELLGTKGFKSGGKKGYVIDLINRESEKQLRQVVFIKSQSAIVMTCRDHIDNFKKSLKNCNQIVRTFEWTDPEELQKVN